MGQILKTYRVPIATLFAIALIGGAYLLARGIGSPPAVQASEEAALLQAIASRDSDSDGLPDWEEALYGADSQNPDTFGLGLLDGAAVAKGLIVPKAIADIPVTTSSPNTAPFIDPSLPPPPAEGTLTAQFSRQFIIAYLEAKQAAGGANLSQDDVNTVAAHVLESLSTSVALAPDFKTASDLAVSGSGPEALKTFAVSAEAVLLKNTTSATTSEIQYLTNVLQNGDTTAIPYLASIASGYRNSAVGLAVLPVPQELAAADLALVNSMMRISEITTDFARVNTDPLATMLALYQYPKAVAEFTLAFVNIWKVYQAAGASLPAGEPGASFVNLIADVAESRVLKTAKP